MFVYLITNVIDGKRYVGQTTTSLKTRWWYHQRLKSCRYLHSAIKKHGAENFTIEVICEPPTIELMNELEAEYIRRYHTQVPNGYNLTEGGRVPRHNVVTREKMRLSHLGLKESEETKHKKSVALLGRVFSPEHLIKLSESGARRKQSEETKKKLVESSTKARAARFWSTRKISRPRE
jgi:group I intron endonuclease